MIAQPLAGKRIVVTRSRQQAGTLSDGLRALGAIVIELPLIEIIPPETYAPLDRALRNLAQYGWLILTSANTVSVLTERFAFLELENTARNEVSTVAIGSATADAMKQQGWRVDLVPDEYVAESVIRALQHEARGSRILLARAGVARDVIPDALTALGAKVDVVDAYRTVIPAEAVAKFREVFAGDETLPDAVTFTSSSTVKHFFALLHESGLAALPKSIHAISIGPITSATLRECGWEPSVEAEQHNVAGIVDAVLKVATSK